MGFLSFYGGFRMLDKEIESLIKDETKRQNEGIELIASENYPSMDVMEAQGSIFTAKYAEGYPNKRYYGGCVNIDKGENLAIEKAKELFNAAYANVQPHSGSQANYAAYHALLPNGGKILALVLADGGHLTHGSPVSFSSHDYRFSFYPLGADAHLDYDEIEKQIYSFDPDLVLSGYSAYPYDISFSKIRSIIDKCNKEKGKKVLFMVDMAHIAGIVAAKLCENPLDYADLVTTTTHKTLRGPRGGLILCNDLKLGKAVDKAVFPYAQGGPLEHVILAKAVAFKEALKPEFKEYMKHVLENTKACNDELAKLGAVVSDTDNHLFLLNVLDSYGITGKDAQAKLEEIGITSNKNMIHNDALKPNLCSGIRLGFAAATSRGCNKDDAIHIAKIIDSTLKGSKSVNEIKAEVASIVSKWKDVTKLSY